MQISRRPAGTALRGIPRLALVLFALLLGAMVLPGAAQAQPGHDHAEHGARRPAPKVKNHHPNPRPGVTGAKVLRGRAVPSRAREPYTIAARIPSLLDGLYCHCECHERDGTRSLLECFEDDMASTCGICQGQARMAAEMHADGKSLAEIRAALDQRWGG
ncbi:MAG TPA: PCYCGC motif-containing (lipo)protein [Longimicrobium sp.]|nr:PCYCGC motif-containing (lipo)protein [Longimicrobium sp.]